MSPLAVTAELAKILPAEVSHGEVKDFLKLHTSPAGALGETFLVRTTAGALALHRSSMLDGFTFNRLEGARPCRLELRGLAASLTLACADGRKIRLDISSLDRDQVERFLGLEVPPGSLVDEGEADPDDAARAAEGEDDEALEPLSEQELDDRLFAMLAQGARAEALVFYRRASGATERAALHYIAELEDELARYPELARAASQGAGVEAEAPLVAAEVEALTEADAADEAHEAEEAEEAEEAGENHPATKEPEVGHPELPPLLEGELIGYLKMGHRAAALGRFRGATGVGMIEAQEAIDRLGRRHGLAPSAGQAFWWWIAFLLFLAAGFIGYFRFAQGPD